MGTKDAEDQMKPQILKGLAALTAISASPAFAEPVVTGKRLQIDEDQVTRVVRFNDLNLATADGEKRLARRVSGAVSYVCAGAANFTVAASCHSYAWNGARPQMQLALAQARTDPALAVATLTSITISAPR